MRNNVVTAILFALLPVLTSCAGDGENSQANKQSDSTLPQVPEGFIVETAADSTFLDFPMFSTLDETGRLFVFESTGNVYDKTPDAFEKPQFRIKLLTDTSGDGVYDKMTVYADSIGFPQGGVFYKGSLYASNAPQLFKLTDTDNDGVADKKEVILSGWKLNVNANSLVGPFLGADGWLYMTNAIEGFDVTSKEGKHLKGETARIWRVRPDGSDLEWISAGGMNNPVELTFTPAGEVIGTETYFTEPQGGERDALVYWIEGGVYPKPNDNINRDKLPRTGELMPVIAKYSRVAPSGIGNYRNSVFGDDHKNNLFSAQFNTHQILRHKLIREGASFKTEDEVFFWKNDEDFHPTDVLEDADGSLLVVETGGWFIKGCPLSQVSKPELKGTIYRVRKSGVKKIDDPYGNQINWNATNAEELAKLLEDARPFVADRAMQALADKKNDAVNALKNVLAQSKNVDARTRAVFALYRAGASDSNAQIRDALNDPDVQVQIAAAKCLGMLRDQQSVDKLVKLLDNNVAAPVRRQAATALGQIGDKKSTLPLLNAAAGDSDRYINHAIIYSLITLDEPAVMINGLSHKSIPVREAALIALDQMQGSPITFPVLSEYLSSGNDKLRKTALWIATHHPEWSGEMINYLEKQFNATLNTEQEQQVKSILVSFAKEPVMQRFISAQMNSAGDAKKMLLLSAMAEAPLKQFPAGWTNSLSQLLSGNDNADIKARVIELVRLRSINGMDRPLGHIANNNKNPIPLRIQAIAAMAKAGKKLNDAHFQFLLSQITSGNEASVKQQAATALEGSALTDLQLQQLAKDLSKTEPFILPRIVPVFAGNNSPEIGKKLATTLQQSPVLDGFSEETITRLFRNYPAEVQPYRDSLLSKLKTARAARLQQLQEYEALLDKGVIDRGRAVFFGKATCSSCHTIGKQGGNMGPDLTSIQRDRSVHDLLEAIVYPSASFVREYETFTVKTNEGTHTGLIKSKSPDAIVLVTSPQASVRINRSNIVSTNVHDVSMMPQGLDKLLTKQEMADLMVFLLGQDQDPETDARILRHSSSQK